MQSKLLAGLNLHDAARTWQEHCLQMSVRITTSKLKAKLLMLHREAVLLMWWLVLAGIPPNTCQQTYLLAMSKLLQKVVLLQCQVGKLLRLTGMLQCLTMNMQTQRQPIASPPPSLPTRL